MPVIKEIIPNQAFEIVREQIGAIIEAERVSQIGLQDTNDEITKTILENTTVWKERFRPMQPDEQFIIVPIFFAGNYDNQSVSRVDADYQFYIDCYGRSKNSEEEELTADMNAARLLQRLVGIVRYIFAHPNYVTLGFKPNNFIRRVHPGSVKRTEIEQTQGGTGAVMYRLVLNVDVCEAIDPAFIPVSITGFDTSVLVNKTMLGYQYSQEQL